MTLKPRNRIYCPSHLSLAATVEFDDHDKVHYLASVLRSKVGDAFALFNQNDGEWLGNIVEILKKKITLRINKFLRPSTPAPTLTLIFAPIKNPNASFYMQKAVELGCSSIWPIITKFTVVRSVAADKLKQTALDAVEQSGRFSLPTIIEALTFKYCLSQLSQFDFVYFCDERALSENLFLKILLKTKPGTNDAIIIGPEGGFSEEERQLLLSNKNCIGVSLGTGILRAETAMITALSLHQQCYMRNDKH